MHNACDGEVFSVFVWFSWLCCWCSWVFSLGFGLCVCVCVFGRPDADRFRQAYGTYKEFVLKKNAIVTIRLFDLLRIISWATNLIYECLLFAANKHRRAQLDLQLILIGQCRVYVSRLLLDWLFCYGFWVDNLRLADECWHFGLE